MGKVHTEDRQERRMSMTICGSCIRMNPADGSSSNRFVTENIHPDFARENPTRSISRYTPHFLFNDEPLWNIPNSHQGKSFLEHMRLRRNWKKWKPRFAGAVHQTIIQQALVDLPANQHWVIDAFKPKISPRGFWHCRTHCRRYRPGSENIFTNRSF